MTRTVPTSFAYDRAMTDRLSGTRWITELDDVVVTVGFDEGAVFGTSGCNAYRSRYTAEGDSLLVPGPIMGTLMMCDEARMDVEARVLAALSATRSFTVRADVLDLLDAAGASVLRLRRPSTADLLGTWAIVNVHVPEREAVVSTDDGLLVEIGDETISGDTGCNRFHGPYRLDGASLTVGPLATTRRAGDPAQMEQERAILGALATVTAWRLGDGRVDLLRPDGGIGLVLVRPALT